MDSASTDQSPAGESSAGPVSHFMINGPNTQGSRSDRTTGNTVGGLSSLSTLTGLLDSASTVTVSRKEDESYQGGNRNRDQNYNGLQRNRYDGYGNQVSRPVDESFRLSGRFGGGQRWKAAGSSGCNQDFIRRHNNVTGPDLLNKSFVLHNDRPNVVATPDSLYKGHTASFGLSTVATSHSNQFRSTLSTPGAPTSTQSYDLSSPTTPSKPQNLSDKYPCNSSSTGVSPASCPTPVVSGSSTPSLIADSAGLNVSGSGLHINAGIDNTTPSTPVLGVGTPGNSGTRTVSAWRPRRPLDSREKFLREVKSHLNKLTVENFPIVGDRICSICSKVQNEDELEALVDLVLDKAFSEPDFSELYADLCLIMSYSSPSTFETLTNKTGQQQSFFSTLIVKKWGDEFNKLPATLDLTNEDLNSLSVEDQEIKIVRMKTRVRGLCVSFGEFIVRRMVGMRGFNTATRVLLAAENPGEHLIEGMCQMLTTAGAFLDNDPVGKLLIENCFGRLQELQGKGYFSKRITCVVQDLMDARKVQWHRKVHKEKAKGLSQIKQEIENADLVGGSVVRAQYGFVVQLGQRSNLVDNAEYARYMNQQETRYRSRIDNNKTAMQSTGAIF